MEEDVLASMDVPDMEHNVFKEEFDKSESSTVNKREDDEFPSNTAHSSNSLVIEDDLKIDTDAWCHVVAGHNSSSPPSTVYIENIPQGCDLSSHLPDTLDVPVYNIELSDQSDDKLSATIELVNATDLPFLVDNKHFFKKQVLEFADASTCMNVEPTQSHIDIEDMENETNYSFVELKALKVTFAASIQGKDTIIEDSLRYMFENKPYTLRVSNCVICENEAFLKFEEDHGVSLVINNLPPLNFLGIDIMVVAIDPTEIPSTSHFGPLVLVIDNLPTKLSDDNIKLQLSYLFELKGYKISECSRILNKRIHIMFHDANAVSKLINDPPDESTLLGHHIRYSVAMEMPDYSGTFVLSINGLPMGFPRIESAVETYLENVAKSKPIYCHVEGEKATVKFENDEDAIKLSNCSSVPPLFGKTLEFSIVPETSDMLIPISIANTSSSSSTKQIKLVSHFQPASVSELRSLSHDDKPVSLLQPVSEIQLLPPVSRPQPTPRSRTRQLHSSLLIKNFPKDYDEQSLIDYLESLTKQKCEDIKINGSKAAVKMSTAVDVRDLRSKLATSCFDEEENVILEIEPLPPSYSCLIKSNKSLKTHSVKWHCIKHAGGEIMMHKNNDDMEYIVTFNSKTELDTFMNSDGHDTIGSAKLDITPYHSMFGNDSKSKSLPAPPRERSINNAYENTSPPLVPPRKRSSSLFARQPDIEVEQSIYQYTPYQEEITVGMWKYLYHITKDHINKDLIKIHGEAHFPQKGVIEIRPFGPANCINEWQSKVQKILEKHKEQFCSKSIPFDSEYKHVILEALQKHQQNHDDFYCNLEETYFEISGCKTSVEIALHSVQHIIEYEVKEYRVLKKIKRQVIEYLMKFEKNEIESLFDPPVVLSRHEEDMDALVLTGVKHSLDGAEKMIQDKLDKVLKEVVTLTQPAYRFLKSPKGKSKLQENLKGILDKICYVYVQNTLGNTHQVFIMSPEVEHLSIAVKMFESLCKERTIPIPEEKMGVASSKQWQKYNEELQEKYFISIRVSSETIVITGRHADVAVVQEKVRTFLNDQHESSEDFTVEGPVWRVIHNSLKKKLSYVKKEAEKRKVKLECPEVGEDDSNGKCFVRMQGGLKNVTDIKAQLQLLINDVVDESFTLSSKPGLRKLDNEGTLSKKFGGIMRSHDVDIYYDVVEDTVPEESMMARPQLLLHATTDGGTTIHILHGAYAKQKCDVIVSFIPVKPAITFDVFVSLKEIGGQQVQDDIEATFIMPSTNLLPGRIHSTCQTGNLQCQEVYHVVLPSFNEESRAQRFLQQMMEDVFDKAFRATYSNIVFCPATVYPLNYPVDVFTKMLIASLQSNRGMYTNGSKVQVFVCDLKDVHYFDKEFRELGVTIEHNNTPVFVKKHSMVPVIPVEQADTVLKSAIKIIKGSIIDQQADVYLNSTNPEMDFSRGALCNLYKEKCGKSLLNEVESYKKQNGNLKPGEVVTTSARNLKAKAIYHVTLKMTSQPDYIDVYKATLEKVLLTAKQNRYKSIAIPCLGVTGLGYPPEISAAVLFESVISFHKKYPLAITEFQFLGFKDREENALRNEYDKRFMHVTTGRKSSIATSVSSYRRHDGALLKVQIYKGNIVMEKANVIVNSTSYDLKEVNEISKAIFRVGGDEMRKECKKLVDAGTSLKNGNVVATAKYGNLECDQIYHVHVPAKGKRDDSPTSNEALLIKNVIQRCLIMAEKNKHESISFPTFCLGIGNYTAEQSGKLMFESFKEFAKTSFPQHLKHIRVVILDQKKYSELLACFQDYFSISSPSDSITLLCASSQSSTIPDSTSLSGHALSSYNHAFPPKQLKKKSSIRFKIYGVNTSSIAVAKKQLQAFIQCVIVERIVDLRNTMKLFLNCDFDEIAQLAHDRGIELEFEPNLERLLLTGEEKSAEIVSQTIETIKERSLNLISELQMYEWVAADDPNSDCSYTFTPYSEESMRHIEAAYKRNLPSVQIYADQVLVNIDFKKWEEIDQATTTGCITRPVKRRLRKYIEDIPGEWDPQSSDSQGCKNIVDFVPVISLTASAEYTKAIKRFMDTSKDYKTTIVSLQRIQNPGEYSKHMSLKHTLESGMPVGAIKEKEVFHGTKQESIPFICSQGGFNRGLAADANAAVYGKGVYYAANASYSFQDKYSTPDKDGNKHILVCSLLIGHTIKGQKDMKIAPNLPNDPMRKYDTLVDDEKDPKIYVAMTDAQAYPKYWITFKVNK